MTVQYGRCLNTCHSHTALQARFREAEKQRKSDPEILLVTCAARE